MTLIRSVADTLHFIDRQYLAGRLSLLRFCSSVDEYRCLLRANTNPVVIGGCARSGTTLLLSLLSCHPNIFAIPFETQALSPNAYGPILNPREADLEDAPPVDVPELNGSPPLYIDFLYRHLHELNFCAEDSERWCEKTPMNVHFVGQLIDFFGEGFRFIHIVRDGRDVVTSQHPEHPPGYWVPPARWIRDVRAGRTYDNESEVLSIRYEDLVDDYLGTLKQICQFIDEPYSSAFESYPETAAIQSAGAWFKGASSVSKRSEQRWKKEEHREIVNQLLSDPQAIELLEHYGYLSE